LDYHASFTVPKETSKGTPVTQELRLVAGTITRVRIAIPAGHHGLAHLRILRYGSHLYPTTRGAYYQGDDEVIVIDDHYVIDGGPPEVVLEGYNTDDTYAHTFEVSFTVRPEERPLVLPLVVSRVLAELQE